MSLTAADITDLRTALELLDQHGELAQTCLLYTSDAADD